MKFLVLFVLVSTSLSAAEFTMKDGTKVNATVLKYTPGTIQLQSSNGVIKEFSEKQFKGESLARMLPKDNIYEMALSLSAGLESMSKNTDALSNIFTNKLPEAISNQHSISAVIFDKYKSVLDLVARYDKEGLLPNKFIDDLDKVLSDIDNKKASKLSSK